MTTERLNVILQNADTEEKRELLVYISQLQADREALLRVTSLSNSKNRSDAVPFVVYHQYADKSGMTIIYVGSDRAAAFDALMAFNDKDPAGDGQVKIVSKGEYSPS